MPLPFPPHYSSIVVNLRPLILAKRLGGNTIICDFVTFTLPHVYCRVFVCIAVCLCVLGVGGGGWLSVCLCMWKPEHRLGCDPQDPSALWDRICHWPGVHQLICVG